MRILLDECLPKKLKLEITADLVLTVPGSRMGEQEKRRIIKVGWG
jgi:hypothetical protein